MISFSEIRVRGPARFIYCAEERPLLGTFSGHKTFICPHGLMFCKLRRQMGRSISPFRPPAPPPSNKHRHARARAYPFFLPTHTHTHTHTYVLKGEPSAGGGCVCPSQGFLVCEPVEASLSSRGLPLLVSEAVFVNMSAILYRLYQ